VQPIVHELEYVSLRIPPANDLDRICNIPIALFKTGRVARVDPENPRFRRSITGSVGVLYGKLRLSAYALAVVIRFLFVLTRHHQGRRLQSKTLAQHNFDGSDQVILGARQSLRRGGKGRWTTGWMVFLVALGGGSR
jgi:hypothetical protein